MSTYNERYDEALNKSPWVSKATSNGRTYLFVRKYAPHPERTGYLFAATDLETVYFEVMTAPSIPTRLAQVAEREENPAAADEINSLGFDEQQQRTEETLRQLTEVFDGDWSSVTVDSESDDYFDAVFVVRSPSVTWLFNMTEMRGRQPLSFVGKHLLSPLALLLAQDRGVDTPSNGPMSKIIGAVLSDPGVGRAIRRVAGAPPPSSSRATPVPPVKVSRAASPTPKEAGRATEPSTSPTPKPKARTPPRSKSPSARPATPERTAASGASFPVMPPSSPTPLRRKAYDYAAGIYPSSLPPSPGRSSHRAFEDSSIPVTASRRVLVPETESTTHRSQLPSSPPRLRVEDDETIPKHPSSTSMAGPPSSTQDPLVPTQPKKKKKKREKDEETQEEFEAEKRRAEMKRRMATGGGGGRLGRRRV